MTTTAAETTMRHLAEGYKAAGHDVIRITPGPADSSEVTSWGRIVTLRAAKIPGTDRRLVTDRWRIVQLLERLSPDRLEVHDRVTLRGLGFWARRYGVPSLVVCHQRLDHTARAHMSATACCLIPVQRIADRNNVSLMNAFDTVVCTTAAASEEFARIAAGNIRHVAPGIDLTNLHPRHSNQQLRTALGITDHEVLLVHVSRLTPERRSDLAVSAVKELLKRGIPAHLVIAGEGHGRAALERSALGLPVTFLGHLSGRQQVGELLATADVVIAPSPVESLGLIAGEALACGTPVIAHRSSSVSELLTPACGAAVAGSGWTFADGIEHILAMDPSTRRSAARARAEEFPWSGSVQGFLTAHALTTEMPLAA